MEREGSWARALAGRLRRAQTSLRTLGIEIAFSREGRAGTRIIRISTSREDPHSKTGSTVSTVGTVIDNGRSWLPGRSPFVKRAHDADDADGADAQDAAFAAPFAGRR